MKKTTLNFLLLLFAVTVMVLAIWGPEAISGYRDKSVLNEIHVKDAEGEGEGVPPPSAGILQELNARLRTRQPARRKGTFLLSIRSLPNIEMTGTRTPVGTRYHMVCAMTRAFQQPLSFRKKVSYFIKELERNLTKG